MSDGHGPDAISFVTSHSIGFIGFGHFGELVYKHLPVVESVIRIHDPRFPADGKKFFSFEEAALCDVVILAVPMSEFDKVLRQVLACEGNGVLIDVCTVKEHPVRLLKELAGDRPWATFHFMFGPEGVKKRDGSLKGLRVVTAEHTLPSDVHQRVTAYLERIGLQVVRMTAEEHDILLAESLFLAQYIGRAISLANFVRSPIGTVSFDLLMDMVEIVLHDAALFRDVVKFVRHCGAIRRRLLEGFARADEEYEMALRS